MNSSTESPTTPGASATGAPMILESLRNRAQRELGLAVLGPSEV